MNRKNIYIYFLGCVSSRGIIIYVAKTPGQSDLYLIGIFYIFMATKFTYSYFLQVTEDKPVFLKPIHALIYFAVAYFAIHGHADYVWKTLLVDLMIGITIHTIYNYCPIVCSTEKMVVLEV